MDVIGLPTLHKTDLNQNIKFKKQSLPFLVIMADTIKFKTKVVNENIILFEKFLSFFTNRSNYASE